MDERLVQFDEKMQKTMNNLSEEFGSIRAGRANPHVLDKLRVDYYGTPTPHICKSCASLPAEKQAELMTLNRLLNLPWRLSKEQLSWLKNRLKDRRPDVRALAQEQYEMRFPPRHLEDDEFNFFDEESFIE